MADRDEKGQFIDGHKGYKPVGAINALSRKSQHYANKLFNSLRDDGKWDTIAKDIGVSDIINLIRIFTPKDLNVKHTGQVNHLGLDISKLTKEQLEQLQSIANSLTK